jgi:hypothetical protein
MQALDNFISPIPCFEGDIPIPTILVSAQPAGGEANNDPSTRASTGASRTWAGKRKATVNPNPHKKDKKATGNQNHWTCTQGTVGAHKTLISYANMSSKCME